MAKTELGEAVRTPAWLFALALVLLALRLFVYVTETANPPKASAEIKWQDLSALGSLPESERKKDKLLFYEFRADWSGPCKEIEKNSFNSKEIVNLLNSNFIAVQVTDRKREDGKNANAVQELEDKYEVQGFPLLVVAMPDGKKLKEHLGALPSSSLKVFLEDAVSVREYFNGKEQIIAGDDKDAGASFDRFIASVNWQHWRAPYAAIFSSVAHRRLGEDKKADEILKNALAKVRQKSFPYPVIEYLCGKSSFDTLLKNAGEVSSNRIISYAYAGMDLSARKDYARAKEYFDWVIAAPGNDRNSFEYRISKAELERIAENLKRK